MRSISLKVAVALAALMVAKCVICAPPEVDQDESCVSDSAQYIAAGPVDESVKERLDVAHKFYPDLLVLLKTDEISKEFVEAMKALGFSDGCRKLEEHLDETVKMVPCFAADPDYEAGLLRVAESNDKAKRAIEAVFACSFTAGPLPATDVDYKY